MTLLVTSIAASTLEELKEHANRAWTGGADAIEVRIDGFKDELDPLAEFLNSERRRRWIITCRGLAEGGRSIADALERANRITTSIRGSDRSVDFELADWQRSGDVRRRLLDAIGAGEDVGNRLILSSHHLNKIPAAPSEIARAASKAQPGAVAKIAYCGETVCDTFAALDVMHDHGAAVIAICMGQEGLASRILARKLGAFATYCSLDEHLATAPGQVTLHDMVNRYRWRAIDAETRVFGVLGSPVEHSMSPLIFNRWFADAGVNAIYLPLHVASRERCLSRFLTGCVDRPWLHIGGFSVTVPHKSEALRWVGEGADRLATSIGALNTLTYHGQRVTGHNTDCHAAVASLIEALGTTAGELANLSVDVLGAGGAARAVVAGLRNHGCRVTVFGRSSRKTRVLADDFGCAPAEWQARRERRGLVLINCTPIGMWPAVAESPMPAVALEGCRLVFDLIYNPLETQLMKSASDSGIRTINGLDMFTRQAAVQFELWTSKRPDTRLTGEMIAGEIRQRTDEGS